MTWPTKRQRQRQRQRHDGKCKSQATTKWAIEAKSLFCNNHNLRGLHLAPFLAFVCKPCLTANYFRLTKHVIGIYMLSFSCMWYNIFWHIYVALILLLRKQTLKKSQPPLYPCQLSENVCSGGGVRHIGYTCERMEMKNTQRYNRTESSIYTIVNENKYLKRESKMLNLKPKQWNPLSEPF